MARLLESGSYDRHLRRMRGLYASRRSALEAAVATQLPGAFLRGVPGGIYAPAQLPRSFDVDALTQAMAERDVRASPLAWFSSTPSHISDVLVLGFGGLSEPAIAEGVRRLADALRAASA